MTITGRAKGPLGVCKCGPLRQAVAVEALLDALLDPERNRGGIFPELVFF